MKRHKIIAEIKNLLVDETISDEDLIHELLEVIEYCQDIIMSKPAELEEKEGK